MTRLDFSLDDAIDALIKYHCLPDTAVVTIEGQCPTMMAQGSDPYFDFLKDLKNISRQSSRNGGSGSSTGWSGKIPMIKELRNRTNLGLKEAKSVVDGLTMLPYSSVNVNDLERALNDVGVHL